MDWQWVKDGDITELFEEVRHDMEDNSGEILNFILKSEHRPESEQNARDTENYQ